MVARPFDHCLRGLLGRDGIVEREPAEDVQVVLALRGISPQNAADQGVDPVRADQHVGFDDLAVGHMQSHAALILLEPVDRVVDVQDARRQSGQQPLVQVRAQQADEPADVAPDNLVGQLDLYPRAAADGPELGVTRSAEVNDVDTEQAECLDGRRP